MKMAASDGATSRRWRTREMPPWGGAGLVAEMAAGWRRGELTEVRLRTSEMSPWAGAGMVAEMLAGGGASSRR
jgi:hypothetical protein